MRQTPFFLLLHITAALCQVAITELNRDPPGGATSIPGDASHEYVEITNFGVDTFSIDSLYLTDGVEIDAVVPWAAPLPLHPDCITGSRVLLPGRTALIIDADYDSALGIAPSSRYAIQPNTVIFTTEDNALGNSLAGDDGVMIYKGTKGSISRMVWCAADSPFSGTTPPAAKLVLSQAAPEGIPVALASFLSGYVDYERATDSASPGFFEPLKNSWFAQWRFGVPDTVGRTFACTLACIKAGANPAGPVRWSVVQQSSAGAVTAADGSFVITGNRASASMTVPLDSVSYSLRLSDQGIESVWQLDVSPLFMPASPVKINEIFPRATTGEPEWIELRNSSHMSLSIKNWTFGNSESRDTVCSGDITLAPGDFLVLAANGALFSQRYPAKLRVVVPPHWHTLDNYHDTIRLWDSRGVQRETVCYRSDWYPDWKYQSLERTAASNAGTDRASWLPATTPSPGQPNGALYAGASQAPELTIGPVPFTPNGDGRDDLLSITARPGAATSASMRIYDFSGRRIREFRGPLEPVILWNGREDNGSPAPPGPFFVVLETKSSTRTAVMRKKGILWR